MGMALSLPHDLFHRLKLAWTVDTNLRQTAIIGTFITSIYNGGAAGLIYAWYDLPLRSAQCTS